MVCFNNVGRMGNYLYECAAAWAYAHKHGLEFTIPHHERDKKWCPIYLHHLYNPFYNPNLEIISLWENGHEYQEMEFKEEWRNKNIIVEGYRQSYKYFDWCRDELLKAFNYPYEMNKGYCSIHVRRGDFLLHPTKHPVVTKEYLIMATDYILDILGWLPKFKIFSDDIAWCKDCFYKMDEVGLVEFSEGKNEVEDFIAMSQCEHNIISNSTMSAWAAEINQNPNKIVVVPSEDNWFGIDNKSLAIHDLYRPEWVQIAY